MATKTHSLIVIAVSIAISAAIFVNAFSRRPAKNSIRLSAKTFHTPAGWGYDILVRDTILIHQETIPCLAGHNGFPTQNLAMETADLIINKLKKGQLPTVTIFEQEQIYPHCANDKPGRSQ